MSMFSEMKIVCIELLGSCSWPIPRHWSWDKTLSTRDCGSALLFHPVSGLVSQGSVCKGHGHCGPETRQSARVTTLRPDCTCFGWRLIRENMGGQGWLWLKSYFKKETTLQWFDLKKNFSGFLTFTILFFSPGISFECSVSCVYILQVGKLVTS